MSHPYTQYAHSVGVASRFLGPRQIVAPSRRRHTRYPIIAQAQYIINGERGPALTTDISSGGVFLKTDTPLPVGKHIEVLIDWPALLDQRCPLRLVVLGEVLRSDLAGTAVGITRYEFRVRAPNTIRLSA
jgi:hypothetical protein